MSIGGCNCLCHTGTGATMEGCPQCWNWHQVPPQLYPQPNVTVTNNINEIKLDQILGLLKDILEELKRQG